MEIDWGAGLVRICFVYLNLSLAMGLLFLAMLALRPVTNRLISPQQRVILWELGWISAYMLPGYGVMTWFHILPVTFRDLITPRVDRYGNSTYNLPAYLPTDFHGTGRYNLALPGGWVFPVEITRGAAMALLLVWVVGIVAVCIVFKRRSRFIRRQMERGEALLWSDPRLERFPDLSEDGVQVRLCEHLPTSFLFWGHPKGTEGIKYTVCLQRELPEPRMELVLRHELEHIRLRHSPRKSYANFALALHWWNPIMWLGHKYFCRDLELACDRAVLNKLEPAQRREYAKTLVELGAGRQLWDAPLCFGECDAAVRVRAAVAWKRPGRPQKAAGIAAFLFLMLFFLGGPWDLQLPQDVLLTWENRGGTVETLAADAAQCLEEAGAQTPVEQLWCDAASGQYDPVLYAKLADESWWKVTCFWLPERDRLDLIGALPQGSPPNVRGMYRLI